ncbi:MAG: hypothetical protein KDA67_00195 [Rhodobacteraceae bacterium]|nr:hypothetical protein [Paracoccaceae bacterium]
MMVIRLAMNRGKKLDWLSWLGLIAAILIPLAMFNIDGYAGLLQRLMFAISFVWVAREFSAPSTRASIPGNARR